MTNLRYVISHCVGVIRNHPLLIDKLLKAAKTEYPDDPIDDKKAEAKNATEEAYMAMVFISGLNQDRYGVMLNDLHNAFRMGGQQIPQYFNSGLLFDHQLEGRRKGTQRVTE